MVALEHFGKEGYVSGKQRKTKIVFKEKWIESDHGDRLKITASVRNPNSGFREYFTITLLDDESGDFVFLTAMGPNLTFGTDEVMDNESDLIMAIGKSVERTILEKIKGKKTPVAMDISEEGRQTSKQIAEQLAEANLGYELHEGKMRKIPEEKPPDMTIEEWAELSQPTNITQKKRKGGKKKRTLSTAPRKQIKKPATEKGKHSYPNPSRGPYGRDAHKVRKMTWRNILKRTKKVDMSALREAVAEWSKENTHREVTGKEVWEEIRENYGSKLKGIIDERSRTQQVRGDKPSRLIGGILIKLGWSENLRRGIRIYTWPMNIPSWQRGK